MNGHHINCSTPKSKGVCNIVFLPPKCFHRNIVCHVGEIIITDRQFSLFLNSLSFCNMVSPEELESAHKKALKALEGEKRAALKKAKALKGKKGKDALEAAENDYANKLKLLEGSYQENLAALEFESMQISSPEEQHGQAQPQEASTQDDVIQHVVEVALGPVDEEAAERERKVTKARKKREKQKEKDTKMEEQIELENANAGPSLRQVELEQMHVFLAPLNLCISEVEADGHCLYRAVAAQSNEGYKEIRKRGLLQTSRPLISVFLKLTNHNPGRFFSTGALCADTLQANEAEFAPFCEYSDDITSFDQYVDSVRNSSEWGGHLELRALGMALDRPIHVYSVQSGKDPLVIHDDAVGQNDPILLSYHLHYFALGEHYNQVIKNEP